MRSPSRCSSWGSGAGCLGGERVESYPTTEVGAGEAGQDEKLDSR